MSYEFHLKKLKAMLGKLWLHNGNQIKIINYHVLSEQGKIQIDIEGKDPMMIKDINKFIEGCLPVEETAVSVEVIQQTNGLINTLQKTLLDNIEKVKNDKEYIKQANVVNSSVNALIGMAKLQLQVEKLKK